MTWLDAVALGIIIVVVALEAWRKTGKALFDAIGGLLSVKIAHLAQPGLAALVDLSTDPDGNQAACFGAVFVLLAALTVVASTLLYRITLFSLPESFEGFVGAVLGIVSAVVVAHALVWMVFTSAGGADNKQNPYEETVAVSELVEWQAYNQTMYHLKRLGD